MAGALFGKLVGQHGGFSRLNYGTNNGENASANKTGDLYTTVRWIDGDGTTRNNNASDTILQRDKTVDGGGGWTVDSGYANAQEFYDAFADENGIVSKQSLENLYRNLLPDGDTRPNRAKELELISLFTTASAGSNKEEIDTIEEFNLVISAFENLDYTPFHEKRVGGKNRPGEPVYRSNSHFFGAEKEEFKINDQTPLEFLETTLFIERDGSIVGNKDKFPEGQKLLDAQFSSTGDFFSYLDSGVGGDTQPDSKVNEERFITLFEQVYQVYGGNNGVPSEQARDYFMAELDRITNGGAHDRHIESTRQLQEVVALIENVYNSDNIDPAINIFGIYTGDSTKDNQFNLFGKKPI